MEGGFINIHHIRLRLLHEDPRDLLCEVPLLMLELHLSGCLGAVYYLWLTITSAVLQVELPD